MHIMPALSLGKDCEGLTPVPSGCLGHSIMGLVALSEKQSRSELEGPSESP